MSKERISTFCGRAAALGYCIPNDEVPRKVRNAAAAARIPAELRSGVWYYDCADIDRIASAVGLRRQVETNQQAA